jgi:hypothetical protein
LIQAAIAHIDSEGGIEKMSEKAGAAITDKPTSTDDPKDDVVDESSNLKIDVQPSSAVGPSTSPKVKRSNSNSPRPIIPGERVSKRVQSQMLTSEKETERLAKRSNVEYCLLAGTLSCTSQNPNYTRLLKSDFNWDDLPMLRACLESSRLLARTIQDREIFSSSFWCILQCTRLMCLETAEAISHRVFWTVSKLIHFAIALLICAHSYSQKLLFSPMQALSNWLLAR